MNGEFYKKLEITRAKFLLHSWRDIDFDFDGLTPNEKEHGDRETFEKLVCFSWHIVQDAEPKWFADFGFGHRHVDAVNAHAKKWKYEVVAEPFS